MANRSLKFVVVGLVGLSLVATSAPAEAALLLRLTSGASTVTITDDGAGDFAGAVDGVIAFIGSVGGFGFNLTTGVSKPILGPAELDLVSINIFTTGTGGELTVELTDTDYTFGIGQDGALAWLFGGTTTGGSIIAQAWKDLNNAEFGLGSITSGPLGPFSGAFSNSGSIDHGILTDPYSMTIRLIYTATGPGQSYSGNFNLQNVPEPAELLLFGIGLTSLGLVARRRRRSQ